MRRQMFLSALVGFGAAAMFATSSVAGEWGTGCGCGYRGISYAQPTYSYAQPTYTIYPHYVVQPNYVIQRTYIVPQTYYQEEPASYLPSVSPSTYSEDYPSEGYAPRYRSYYRPLRGARLYNNPYVHRSYVDARALRGRGVGRLPYRRLYR